MSRRQGFLLANTLAGHSDSVWSVTISRDGQSLASGSEDKHKMSGYGELLRLSDHSDAVRAVAISPDKTLASASGTRQLRFGD